MQKQHSSMQAIRGFTYYNVSYTRECIEIWSRTSKTLKMNISEWFAHDEQHRLMGYAENQLSNNILWKMRLECTIIT